jgi:hypothetical protein
MKKIIAISIVAFGLAGCTPREQQLVAAGAVGALAGAVVASGASESYHRPYYHRYPYYAPPRPYYANPRPRCFTTWERTPYGMRERLICRKR